MDEQILTTSLCDIIWCTWLIINLWDYAMKIPTVNWCNENIDNKFMW